MTLDQLDPKGLIRESYRIDGITDAECRSIFLDWALGVPSGENVTDYIVQLLDIYGPAAQTHPMTNVLTEGMAAAVAPKRRGGWRARDRG